MKQQMKLGDHILLWNHASIRVMDIRHNVIESGEELLAYRLPASAFLYTTRGKAHISLDGTETVAERFHILHGGKGMSLEIRPDGLLEYYMIMYKAVLPQPSRRELVSMMESNNPFRLQYSFMPGFPVVLLNLLQQMEQEWERPGQLEQLHIKTLFYHFVYEIFHQLAKQGIQVQKADPVQQAVRYLEEHYARRIMLDDLAELLDCSVSYLSRRFKRATGYSPIDYLIAYRIGKAKELLATSDATLQEIAESVGFQDDSYFHRIFKKQVGVSPGQFKQKVQNNPVSGSRYAIVPPSLKRYSDYENHYQYEKEGPFHMYRGSRLSMAATLLICITLLLGACSAGTSSSNTTATSGNNTATSSSTQTASEPATEGTQRVIKHAMGETTLTGTPQRVVILTNEGTEALLAVGVKPVGAVMSWSGDPWYDHIKDEMQDVTVVGDELQPNIELIASLKPDLIIGNKVRQEKIYEQLNQIAPTVFAETLAGNWKINFELYMQALNKEEEGDKAMADFDQRVAEVKAKVGDKAATKISVVRFSEAQVRIYQKQTFSGVLFEQLGFARPESQDKDDFMEVLTKESIPKMDGDVMFYFVTETEASSGASKVAEEWMNDPLFKNLNVAKNNKVVQVDEAIWNTAGGYKAANLLLDEIVDYFDIQ